MSYASQPKVVRWQQSKSADSRLYEFAWLAQPSRQTVMPDDHSELVPLLPIPNRTVKRLCADDSAGSRVKVGHRQALIEQTPKCPRHLGVLFFLALEVKVPVSD